MISTCSIESRGRFNNKTRIELLLKIIEKLRDKSQLIILPTGYLSTPGMPSELYADVTKAVCKVLKANNDPTVICIGIDGRSSKDQIGIAID